MKKSLLLLVLCLGLFSISEFVHAQCSGGETQLTVNITTDNYGSETSWEITDAATGAVYGTGSGYGNNATTADDVCVPSSATVIFTIFDEYGDGMCCSYGTGSYDVTDGTTTFASGGAFGNAESTAFNITPTANDLMVLNLAMNNVLLSGDHTLTGTIVNLGTSPVSSFDLSWSSATTSTQTQTVSMSLAPGASYTFSSNTDWCAEAGAQTVEVWVDNINGAGADDNPGNDLHSRDFQVASALAQRVGLVEEFTNAYCYYCGVYNPDFYTELDDPSIEGLVARIIYHPSWPGSADPIYAANTAENSARTSYYGVGGTPTAYLNGASTGITSFTAANYSTWINTQSSPVAFTIDESMSGSNVNIDVTLDALTDITNTDLSLLVVMVEDIEYTSAPGSNGETHFPWSFRDIVLNESISGGISAGSNTYSATYTPGSGVDMNEVHTIVFLQDNADKSVIQALVTPDPSGTNTAVSNTITQTGTACTPVVGSPCDDGSCVEVMIDVLLEGPLDPVSGEMLTNLNAYLPTAQPFNTAPWNYADNGDDAATSIPVDAVDWVYVEALDASYNAVDGKAGLLLSNGRIADPSGYMDALLFDGLTAGMDYHFIVRHRNHLDIISANTTTVPNTASLDLRDQNNVEGGSSQLYTYDGAIFTMLAGDYQGDGIITVADFNAFDSEAGAINDFFNGDANLDGNVTVTDMNLYLPNSSKIGSVWVQY